MRRLAKKTPPPAATHLAAPAPERSATLADLNKRLADSREARLRAAEANCMKLTGRPRL